MNSSENGLETQTHSISTVAKNQEHSLFVSGAWNAIIMIIFIMIIIITNPVHEALTRPAMVIEPINNQLFLRLWHELSKFPTDYWE